MNIGKIVLQLERLSKSSTDAFDILVLSKAIKKLKAGTVTVVNTTAELPTLPLSSDGELYLVDGDSDLYVNFGSQWRLFPTVIENFAYAWGYNRYGQLGDNTTTHTFSPVSVVGGITNWSQLSSGDSFSLGITSTGVAYGWGYNTRGRLGDGTITSRRSPVTVVGGLTWSQIHASEFRGSSIGITTTGVAYAWGDNISGQLGDGTTVSKSSPVTVAGGLTWSQIAIGSIHSVGITTTGVAYTWGSGNFGRQGDGTTNNRSSPGTVAGGLTWSQVSAGQVHCLAITTGGVAYAWGRNGDEFLGLYSGILGDGTTTDRSSPVSVVGGITNWVQVSAGGGHSLGLTSSGIAYAWGTNDQGKLGVGDNLSRLSPTTVIGGITNWSRVQAGGAASLGITTTGQAYGWGYGRHFNGGGRLGNGTEDSFSSPRSVLGPSNWVHIAHGKHSTLGILAVAKTL